MSLFIGLYLANSCENSYCRNINILNIGAVLYSLEGLCNIWCSYCAIILTSEKFWNTSGSKYAFISEPLFLVVEVGVLVNSYLTQNMVQVPYVF